MADRMTAEPRAARDYAWLIVGVCVLVATGLGLRDPWPADEPRFALIARDMVLSGDWLFPQVGGDLYPDKPPIYFWFLALCQLLFGSVRVAFLIPSLLAAFGVTFIVYDLAARLHGREAAFRAALCLIGCVQFLMVMRGAQIDATLSLLTTFSLYGLLRHLFLGPRWGWYCAGAFAAGLGVVTKGVGFLPLLVLLPYAAFRRWPIRQLESAHPLQSARPLPPIAGGARWLLAVPAFLLGTAVWLGPMLTAVLTHPTPARRAYVNEILFHQTVGRYSAAWHHIEPWYYYLLNVIPALWMPLSLLLIWLVPCWIRAVRARDARTAVLLSWTALVIAFFSASAGKRGIYVFPALPALALAAAPLLPEILRRPAVRRTALGVTAAVLVVAAIVAAVALAGEPRAAKLLASAPASTAVDIAIFAAIGVLLWVVAWRTKPALAWPFTVGALALVWAFLVTPAIDGERSARDFMRHVEQQAPAGADLALLAYKEQFLLQARRPIYNFGHARWREAGSEVDDAARWLNDTGGRVRVLLVPNDLLSPCFADSARQSAGNSSGGQWWLVSPPASVICAARGDPDHLFHYQLSSVKP